MTSPTPTPPCLGEREAVARTGERQAILWLVRVGRLTRSDSATMTDAIIAQHIEPLRTENETLRAEVARLEADSEYAGLAIADRDVEIDATKNEIVTLRNELDAAIARAEEAERKVGDLSATITAWEGAFGTIQSHLQDRIAMNDPARPDTYLRIVESSVGELPRISRQIYAATQYRSQSTQAYANRVDLENETLTAKLAQAEGEIATMRGALALALRFVDRAAGEGLCFTEGDHGEPSTDAADVCCAVAHTLGIELDSDEFRALTTPEPPHGD